MACAVEGTGADSVYGKSEEVSGWRAGVGVLLVDTRHRPLSSEVVARHGRGMLTAISAREVDLPECDWLVWAATAAHVVQQIIDSEAFNTEALIFAKDGKTLLRGDVNLMAARRLPFSAASTAPFNEFQAHSDLSLAPVCFTSEEVGDSEIATIPVNGVTAGSRSPMPRLDVRDPNRVPGSTQPVFLVSGAQTPGATGSRQFSTELREVPLNLRRIYDKGEMYLVGREDSQPLPLGGGDSGSPILVCSSKANCSLEGVLTHAQSDGGAPTFGTGTFALGKSLASDARFVLATVSDTSHPLPQSSPESDSALHPCLPFVARAFARNSALHAISQCMATADFSHVQCASVETPRCRKPETWRQCIVEQPMRRGMTLAKLDQDCGECFADWGGHAVRSGSDAVCNRGDGVPDPGCLPYDLDLILHERWCADSEVLTHMPLWLHIPPPPPEPEDIDGEEEQQDDEGPDTQPTVPPLDLAIR